MLKLNKRLLKHTYDTKPPSIIYSMIKVWLRMHATGMCLLHRNSAELTSTARPSLHRRVISSATRNNKKRFADHIITCNKFFADLRLAT